MEVEVACSTSSTLCSTMSNIVNDANLMRCKLDLSARYLSTNMTWGGSVLIHFWPNCSSRVSINLFPKSLQLKCKTWSPSANFLRPSGGITQPSQNANGAMLDFFSAPPTSCRARPKSLHTSANFFLPETRTLSHLVNCASIHFSLTWSSA